MALVKCAYYFLETHGSHNSGSCGIQQLYYQIKSDNPLEFTDEHKTLEPRSLMTMSHHDRVPMNFAGEQQTAVRSWDLLIGSALGLQYSRFIRPVFYLLYWDQLQVRNCKHRKAEIMIMVEEATRFGEYRQVVDLIVCGQPPSRKFRIESERFFQKPFFVSTTLYIIHHR